MPGLGPQATRVVDRRSFMSFRLLSCPPVLTLNFNMCGCWSGFISQTPTTGHRSTLITVLWTPPEPLVWLFPVATLSTHALSSSEFETDLCRPGGSVWCCHGIFSLHCNLTVGPMLRVDCRSIFFHLTCRGHFLWGGLVAVCDVGIVGDIAL
jgi:hypothetical protein